MSRWSAGRAVAVVLVCAAAWAAVAALCLFVGSTGGVGWPNRDQLDFRVKPVLLASLVGAALAAAGVTYQAILRNPLADPYLLGVSSGASLMAFLWQSTSLPLALVAVGGGGATRGTAAVSQQTFAFAGALASLAVVLLLGRRRGRIDPVTLLLVGVVVNAVNASAFMLLTALQRDRPAAGGPLQFLVGGINTTLTAEQRTAAALVFAAGWVVLFNLAGQLNVAGLSDAEAESLGVRVGRLRWVGLVTASLVTAAAAAVSGPIGFVGLVCPHLARLLVGSDVRRLLPAATACGAAVLAVADAASRFLAADHRAQTLLPVGVLTGFLGGPFFLYLLWRQRGRSEK